MSPRSLREDRRTILHELAQAVDELRADARKKGLDQRPARAIGRAVPAPTQT